MLFSATLSPKTADFAKLSLKKEPLYISIDELTGPSRPDDDDDENEGTDEDVEQEEE
jgi:superfamily II DNA/RNA helicase